MFLQKLSYCVTWHMENCLALMLFKGATPEAAEAARISPGAPAQRSDGALKKIQTKRTAHGWPVCLFKSLLGGLGTICLNKFKPTEVGFPPFSIITTPTPVQRRALELLGVSCRLGVASSRWCPDKPEKPGKRGVDRSVKGFSG